MGPNTECTAGQATAISAQPKHLNLFDEIEALDEVKRRLGSLLNRVMHGNGGPDDAPNPECTAVSLRDFLENAPDELRGKRNNILQLINELEEVLF